MVLGPVRPIFYFYTALDTVGKANSGGAQTERATRHFLDVLAEAMTTKMTFPTSRMTLNADG